MVAPKLQETIRTLVMVAGLQRNTGRLYSTTVLRKMVETFKPGLGEFVHAGEAPGFYYDLGSVSHRTQKITLRNEDTELWATVQLLDTPHGRLVRDLHKSGNVKFFPSILGVVNEENEVEEKTVQFERVFAYGTY
jgi:hypothetical protein